METLSYKIQSTPGFLIFMWMKQKAEAYIMMMFENVWKCLKMAYHFFLSNSTSITDYTLLMIEFFNR